MSEKPPSVDLQKAAMLKTATKLELDASLMVFEAAVYRDSAHHLSKATEASQAALQAHLDAIAGV